MGTRRSGAGSFTYSVNPTTQHTLECFFSFWPNVKCVNLLSSSGVGVLKGLLYAVGGHDGPLVRKSCEVYDPASNSWRQVADMNMCRRNAGNADPVRPTTHPLVRDVCSVGCALIFALFVFSGVCAVNNLLYVVGGDDGSCNLASVEFYNPNSDKWTLLPTCMSTGRSYAGV